VPAVDTSGASDKIAVAVDQTLKVVEGGTVTTPTGRLLTEGGDNLTTEGGDYLLASLGDVPAACFLVSRGQVVYAIHSGGVTSMDLDSGVVNDLDATSGTVPASSSFGAVYRDRLFVSGDDNAIYISRQGDFLDWDYGADLEDAGAATVIQLSGASGLGKAPTALMPYQDRYCLAATATTLWVIRGDPVAGGGKRQVSPDVGVIGSRAWAEVEDAFIFLSNDGLYLVRADGTELKKLSGEVPKELYETAVDTNTINLVYNHVRRGVHVFVKPDTPPGTHWFYHLESGFWADRFQSDHEPLAACRFGDAVVIGQADGYLREATGDNDDGTNIESHVLLGPIRLAATADSSVLTELEGSLAQSSADVNWRIVIGDTANEAAESAKTAVTTYIGGDQAGGEAYADANGTFSADRNRRRHPRIRAPWFVIWLQSTGKWAFEWMTVRGIEGGRYR
jgi:hypothetical protein